MLKQRVFVVIKRYEKALQKSSMYVQFLHNLILKFQTQYLLNYLKAFFRNFITQIWQKIQKSIQKNFQKIFLKTKKYVVKFGTKNFSSEIFIKIIMLFKLK